MKPYRFLEPAREELFDISDHYEDQAAGLGTEFLAVVAGAIALLRENSLIGAPIAPAPTASWSRASRTAWYT